MTTPDLMPCEKCAREFEYPETGDQPTHGEFEGVHLCSDCYLAEENDDDDA